MSFLLAAATHAQTKPTFELDGVTEHRDVHYLPDWRYTGADGERGDAEMLLDLYLPPGDGPHPLVIYVHGGGYGGGSKKIGSSNRQFATRLLEEGFALASINYILHPKGIFPQAWWDYSDAVRFLRRNAEEYQLDPLRFGAYGLSAGGWLLSSATAGNGDLIRKNNNNALSTSELKEQGWAIRTKNPNEPDSWLRPMRDPSPSYPGIHSGVSAMSFDFDHYMHYVTPYNAIYQKWAGIGYSPQYMEAITANGAEKNLEFARMAHPKFEGKKVHVPPFYSREAADNPRNEAIALAADGKTIVPLGEVALDFFKRQLVKECRLPTPEIYPVPRVFAESTEVTMVAPPGATIRFTTDGSEPAKDSPSYSRPIAISDDTVIKAFASLDGFTSSGTNIAHFVKGQPAPEITSPETLPVATTGKPCSITFETDLKLSGQARFLILGELVPHVPWKKTQLFYPNNMALDTFTGVWSGTPHQPGKFWIQIWVNRGDGTHASHKNYLWEVKGEDLPGESWEVKATEGNNNVELARLIYEDGWGNAFLKLLRNELKIRGVRAILVGEGEEDRMLLVEQGGEAGARAALGAMTKRFKKLGDRVDWVE